MLTDFSPSYMQAFGELQELDNTTPQERFYNVSKEVIARFDEATRFDDILAMFALGLNHATPYRSVADRSL